MKLKVRKAQYNSSEESQTGIQIFYEGLKVSIEIGVQAVFGYRQIRIKYP